MQTRQICLACPPTGKTLKKSKWEENLCNLSPWGSAYRHGGKTHKIIFGFNIVYYNNHSHIPLTKKITLHFTFSYAIMYTWITLWGAVQTSVLTPNPAVRHKKKRKKKTLQCKKGCLLCTFVHFLFDWCSQIGCYCKLNSTFRLCICFHPEIQKNQGPWAVGCPNYAAFPGGFWVNEVVV